MRQKIFTIKNLIIITLILIFSGFIYLIYLGKDIKRVEFDKKEINETKPDKKPVEKNKISLKKLKFEDLEGFDKDNFRYALPALLKSCEKIIESPKDRIVKKIYHEQACNALMNITTKNDKSIRQVIEKYYEPYLVSDEQGNFMGTFTGYYSAKLKGSYEKTDVYKYPLYKLPKDLITIDMSTFTDCVKCTYTARIDDKGKLVPYYSNKDISEGNIAGEDVLMWVDSPVDALLLHIQGSGTVSMPDGKQVKINYAGNNGHGFVGIGWILKMIEALEPGKGSMQDVKEWLKRNPNDAKKLMLKNPRYIFFKEAENNEGPIGSLGVELTPKRSLAVDNDYIPLGLFVFINTKYPDGEKLQRLVTAQDTGAAIKGIVRGDFYFGSGEKAFEDAGKMKSSGSYYLVLPKEQIFHEIQKPAKK